ncbi:MAG: hypothetical protein K2M68_10145 [Muribaculaceae bacterium]|nr:hypothetical protein [Muribaculaceae bacterium]
MNFKSIYFAGIALFALTVTSCSDDVEYVPAQPIDTPAAYFNPSVTYSFELGEGDSEITVYASRANNKGEETVTITNQTDAAGIFNVPSTVTFADGANEAAIDITVDTEAMEGAKQYLLNLILGDGENTPYFNLTCPVSVAYFPWVDLVGPNGEEFGIYGEDIILSMYRFNGLESPFRYEVKIQSSPAVKGLYRVINPYAPEYCLLAEVYDYDASTNHYMYFNAADPNKVFLCNEKGEPTDDPYYTGLTIQAEYGECFAIGYYNYALAQTGDESKAVPYAGKLSNGVVTFPAKALLVGESEDPEGLYYGNSNSNFRIIFPGATEEGGNDDDAWEDLGEATYTDPFIYPAFGVAQPVTYSVPVQQSIEDPNFYRLVNPYKAGVMPDGDSYDGNKYIIFDVTDPDCVLIPDLYATGFQAEDDGEAYVTNYAGALYNIQGATLDQIKQAGYNDTFKDGVITIGVGHGMINFPDSSDEEEANSLYVTNGKNAVVGKIVLPSAAASAPKKSAAMNQWLSVPSFKLTTDYIDMPFKVSKRTVEFKH